MSLSPFDWGLLRVPLAAGLIVLVTHVIFGREVLARGIIFIDLTIAQIAALGVVVAELFSATLHDWQIQLVGGGAALAASALLVITEKHWPVLQEALIGCLYVVAASAAILVLANNPHGAEHFAQLLAGQILWVTADRLVPIGMLSSVILVAWFFVAKGQRAGFYPLFALAVTASVQLVGVYLVFASLILPALAAHGLGKLKGYIVGYGVGILGYVSGLVLSVPTDLPSGPLIVCALAVLALSVAGLRRLGNLNLRRVPQSYVL